MNTLLRKTLLLVAVLCLSSAHLYAQLSMRSVGSVQKKGGPMQVTVVFTEPVDPVTGADKSKYDLGAGVTINAASLMTGLPGAADIGNGEGAITPRVLDNQCAVLEVSGLGTTSTTLTVTGVKSADGSQTLNGNKAFIPSGYSWTDVAVVDGTRKPGQVIAISDEGFDIFNNGRAGWAGNDEYTLVYKEVTGDFEYKARMEFSDYASRWARSGIMVREQLDDGAAVDTQHRYVSAHSDPVRCINDSSAGIAAANNAYESNYRAIGAPDAAANTTAGNGGGTPAYPNAWVRLQRVGDTITASYSNDNGATWEGNWERVYPFDPDATPLPATMYLGPAYCAETGNFNAANAAYRDRLFLTQVRFKELVVPTVRAFTPNPTGFRFQIVDSPGGLPANPSTVLLKLNGASVTPLPPVKVGDTTTVVYTQTDAFPLGSANTVDIEFKDGGGTTLKSQQKFTSSYVVLPAANALASPASTVGLSASTYQIDYTRGGNDENLTAAAEQQQARGVVDPANGNPWPNVANPAANNTPITTVNWEQFGGDIGTAPETGPDHFNTALPTSAPTPNDAIPGIPFTGNDQSHTGVEAGAQDNNIVVETVAYLRLKKGAYRMGVNSDDGFKVTCAPGAPDVFGTVIGEFNGGRGAGDTKFDFVVTVDGDYPFRLLWWEGSGGANCEWFTEDLISGDLALVNGGGAAAVAAYRTGNGRAYVKSLVPANGYTGVDPASPVKAELVNGTTSVVAGQTKLMLDGAEVASGGNSVSYTPPAPLEFNSVHSGQLIWTESTTPPTEHVHDFAFTVRSRGIPDLPANCFTIEAEHFDNNGVAPLQTVGSGYSGEEYRDLSAVHNVDYYQDSNEASNLGLYRAADLNPNVPMDSQADAAPNLDTARPGFEVSTNFKIGWAGNGEWYDYTRTIPAGIYTMYAAHSVDPAGDVGGTLGLVTGAGTQTQTVKNLATSSGRAPGGWGNNGLVPSPNPAGGVTAFKLPGGKVTLRYTTRTGDFDWFTLAPLDSAPAQISSATPANGEVVNLTGAKIEAAIEDFNGIVTTANVKLEVDGADVTANASITKAKVGDITTVVYNLPDLVPNSSHSYTLTIKDSLNNTKQVTAAFKAYPVGAAGMFAIEAEDYDYNGGQHVAAADASGYPGGAYNGLAATLDTDYFCDNGNDSDIYRPDTAPNNVNLNDNLGGFLGRQRGMWNVTVNYKHGWVGATHWFNYTRNFQPGNYLVYAALSYGETPEAQPHGLRAHLDIAGQTVGLFDGPATGGWGSNALVPMTDFIGGPAKTLAVGAGATTYKFWSESGDFDYFLLVPGGAPQPTASIGRDANGKPLITYTGTLVSSPTVNGTYQPVQDATSPYSPPNTDGATFYQSRNP